MSKVILALVILSVNEKKFVIKFNILTFIIYTKTVKDSI